MNSQHNVSTILTDESAVQLTAGNYGYTAPDMTALGSSEYTLATVLVDVSGSVEPYHKAIEEALKSAVSACKFSPRADNLMVRVLPFNHNITQELIGFRLLGGLNPNDFTGKVPYPSGGTALFDATLSAIEVTEKYGSDLVATGMSVNGIVFVITDGQDEHSKSTLNSVKNALARVRQDEKVESLKVVVIGLISGGNSTVDKYLQDYANAVGADQYVSYDLAKDRKLAKLGDFVSKSVSSTSQALGTKGPSANLPPPTF